MRGLALKGARMDREEVVMSTLGESYRTSLRITEARQNLARSRRRLARNARRKRIALVYTAVASTCITLAFIIGASM